MSENSSKFEQWALVELMGHQRIAGLVTEQEIGGHAFLRVDVPNLTGNGFAFTRFYSASAVYCISPTDKQIAVGLAAKCSSRPVNIYDLGKLVEYKKAGQGEERYEEPE